VISSSIQRHQLIFYNIFVIILRLILFIL
jgi:hypothetical protein